MNIRRNILLIVSILSISTALGQKIEILRINIADNVEESIVYDPPEQNMPFSDTIEEIKIYKNIPRLKVHLRLVNDSGKEFRFNGYKDGRKDFSVIFSHKRGKYEMNCHIAYPNFRVDVSSGDSLEIVLLCGSSFFSNKNYAQEFLNIMSTFRVTYDIKKDSGIKRIKTPKLKIQSVTFDNVSK